MPRLNLSKVKFTNEADKVYSDSGIFNPVYSNVNTLKGADEIIGSNSIDSDFGLGVFVGLGANNIGTITSADISSKATVYANGINNKGNISKDRGRDVVKGTATAKIAAITQTVSEAIAYADQLNTTAITQTFAAIDIKAIANGINNSGKLLTGQGSDTVDGEITASVAAVATATADATAIVQAIAKAPISDNLTAFSTAIAQSLANATITATGIRNIGGKISTGQGADTISAIATSDSATYADTSTFSLSSATPENQALAQAVAEAIAKAEDKAIAIDNTKGYITLGEGRDTINANANATNKAIAIDNTKGYITFGNGRDTINATADAVNKAIAIDNTQGTIKTGQRADIIKAYATGTESYGIFGGDVQTGDGSDELTASSFGGGVNIKMGDGKDFVEGFGDAMVSGGRGFDTLSFSSYKIDDFNISLGANSNQVIFEHNDAVMTTTKFEQFNFDNGNLSLSYDDLVATL